MALSYFSTWYYLISARTCKSFIRRKIAFTNLWISFLQMFWLLIINWDTNKLHGALKIIVRSKIKFCKLIQNMGFLSTNDKESTNFAFIIFQSSYKQTQLTNKKKSNMIWNQGEQIVRLNIWNWHKISNLHFMKAIFLALRQNYLISAHELYQHFTLYKNILDHFTFS